jgi:acetyltransferase-like isoleucine patch superfamily enzyme
MNNIWFLLDRIKERLLFIYRKNVFLARINSDKPFLKVLGKVYVNASNVKIGENLTLYPGVYFWGDGEIKIGDNVKIGVGTIIYAKNVVSIGNNVAIAANCYIIDSNHKVEKGILIRNQSLDIAENGIQIGNDVWIGAGCTIIKGAKINDGAVIGAMSLVNSEIKMNSIAYGIPARIIKQRE